MIEAPHFSAAGAKKKAIALPEAIFDGRVNEDVLHRAVVTYLANQRQGTAATKTRSFVSGGNQKPWRQKGTGRARQGSTRAPHWRHGGVVFGPNGRLYEQRVPRRIRRAALGACFAERAADGRVLVLESLVLDGDRPRSRVLVDWLANVGEVRSAVIVTSA